MKEQIKRYMKQSWMVLFIWDSMGGWFVQVIGLKGCMSQGETLDEACYMIVDAMETWLEISLEDGDEIPPCRFTILRNYEHDVALPMYKVRRVAEIYKSRTGLAKGD